jgi:hypothetical protein
MIITSRRLRLGTMLGSMPTVLTMEGSDLNAPTTPVCMDAELRDRQFQVFNFDRKVHSDFLSISRCIPTMAVSEQTASNGQPTGDGTGTSKILQLAKCTL